MAQDWIGSGYNAGVKLICAFVNLAFLVALPAVAQIGPPQKFTPQKFCSSSDNSLECVSQRNQANINRYGAAYKEQVRKDAEKLEAERLERDRQRTVKQKDCNPRVQRCD